MKNKIFFMIVMSMMVLAVTGCGKKIISGTDRTGMEDNIAIVEDAEETAEEVPEEKIETYAFDGLEEKYHTGMTVACEAINADKANIRNFKKEDSADESVIYSFEYGLNKFGVEFNKDNVASRVYIDPDQIDIYKDGFEGLDIDECCVQEDSIDKLKEALTKSFEAGVDMSEFDLTYDWETCTIERVKDYYIIRVDGLATYKVNERRAEPKIRCDLIKSENTYSVLYFSVQNGERINEYGKIQLPDLNLKSK